MIDSKLKNLLKTIKIVRNWPMFIRDYLHPRGFDKNLYLTLRTGEKIVLPSCRNAISVFIETFIHEEYNIHPTDFELDTILDLGGFLGMTMIYLTRKLKNAKYYVFEPNPRNFDYMVQNIHQNKLHERVIPFMKAVSNRNGTEKLYFSAQDCGGSLLKSAKSEYSDIEKEKSNFVETDLISFESVIDMIHSENVLLKMDIEGSEYDVFYKTKPEKLKKIKVMMVECHYRDDDMRNDMSLLRYLMGNGFHGYICRESKKPRLSFMYGWRE